MKKDTRTWYEKGWQTREELYNYANGPVDKPVLVMHSQIKNENWEFFLEQLWAERVGLA